MNPVRLTWGLLIGLLIGVVWSNIASAASTGSCFDTDTELMLHWNEADGSTSTDDASNSNHTLTANGNAQTDNGQTKFSNTSVFDGTGDYWSIPDHNDFDFGTGDFTIDFWVRFSTVSGGVENTIYSHGDSSGDDGTMNIYVFGGQLAFRVWIQDLWTWSPSTDTWYHVAITRASGTVRAFVDGSALTLAGGGSTGAKSISNTNEIRIGQRNGSAGNFTGNLEEFRVIKGFALWTSNFTPASAEYTDCNAVGRRIISIS